MRQRSTVGNETIPGIEPIQSEMAKRAAGRIRPSGVIGQAGRDASAMPSFQAFDADRHKRLVGAAQDNGSGGAELSDRAFHRCRGAVFDQTFRPSTAVLIDV